MFFVPRGRHLLAGDWLASVEQFQSAPAWGPSFSISEGVEDHVDKACVAADDAFSSFGYSSRSSRAAFLRNIAAELDDQLEALKELASRETGLPEQRIQGELGRTTGQLRLFAAHIEAGNYLDRHRDEALPDRAPAPRPELRSMQRPIGPVAVFGASNFPLAFSVAGGDTAAALAAGCPVVVKGHPAHPGTSELVAMAISQAIAKSGFHPGVLSLVQGSNIRVGTSLVKHPLIKAVGFTGSHRAGRHLFNLCAARPEPIPFFGELGSVNPMFILPAAMRERPDALAMGWTQSLTLGVGQFCTNPGIVFLQNGSASDQFRTSVLNALSSLQAQTMLTAGIADAFRNSVAHFTACAGVTAHLTSASSGRNVGPALFEVSLDHFLANRALHEEAFGPLGLIVNVNSASEFKTIIPRLEGQLTATIHMADADKELCRQMIPLLERKAGRVIINGFPTGVEVVDSMVHGGPYPASTNFGATSVGTMSIRRFLRPVAYQNFPADLLPVDLQSEPTGPN